MFLYSEEMDNTVNSSKPGDSDIKTISSSADDSDVEITGVEVPFVKPQHHGCKCEIHEYVTISNNLQ